MNSRILRLSLVPSFCAAALALAACDTETPAIEDGGTAAVDSGGSVVDSGGSALPATLGPAERPARLIAPPGHDGVTEFPIVFLLHGYGASAAVQDTYFMASAEARRSGYYLVLPDGTMDTSGRRFWNATPACCDFGPTGVDDVAYLTGLLDEAVAALPIDEDRVYFIGHSNGGFMSYRMACELSDRIAAIVSLAGSDFIGEMDCVPSQPVSVLQVHGDMDDTIAYGGAVGGFPSARADIVRWATRAGCTDTPVAGEALDLESTLAGAETEVETWTDGCAAGHDYALWSIRGGGHIPGFTRNWGPAYASWLLAHER